MSDLIEFSGHVEAEDYKKFKENFPQYGAVKWFIGTSLRLFNEEVEKNPTAKALIERSIAEMLATDRALASGLALADEDIAARAAAQEEPTLP